MLVLDVQLVCDAAVHAVTAAPLLALPEVGPARMRMACVGAAKSSA